MFCFKKQGLFLNYKHNFVSFYEENHYLFVTKFNLFSLYLIVFIAIIFVIVCLSFVITQLKNPISAVGLLISVFLLSSFFIILSDKQFVGINIIIIYLGAILVLLLFVILLANTKIAETRNVFFLQKQIFILIIYFFITQFIYFLKILILENKNNVLYFVEYNNNIRCEIVQIVQCLYNQQRSLLYLSIVVLIASLLISLDFTTEKKPNNKIQLLFFNCHVDEKLFLKYFCFLNMF